jgi:hypothetical protein
MNSQCVVKAFSGLSDTGERIWETILSSNICPE